MVSQTPFYLFSYVKIVLHIFVVKKFVITRHYIFCLQINMFVPWLHYLLIRWYTSHHDARLYVSITLQYCWASSSMHLQRQMLQLKIKIPEVGMIRCYKHHRYLLYPEFYLFKTCNWSQVDNKLHTYRLSLKWIQENIWDRFPIWIKRIRIRKNSIKNYVCIYVDNK